MTLKAVKVLTCAFGEPWLGPHPLCRAEIARVCGVSIEDVRDPGLSAFASRVRQDAPDFTNAEQLALPTFLYDNGS